MSGQSEITLKVVWIKQGNVQWETWYTNRHGKQLKTMPDLNNHISFANFDLRNNRLPTLSLRDGELEIRGATEDMVPTISQILNYHGFELMPPIDGVAAQTIEVILGKPDQRTGWVEALHQLHSSATAGQLHGYTAFLTALIKVVRGTPPDSIHPSLDGAYASCWENFKNVFQAFTEAKGLFDPIVQFTNAQSWEEKRAIVEKNQHILLGGDVDFVFQRLIDRYADDAEVVKSLGYHRELLEQCKHLGIDYAFSVKKGERAGPRQALGESLQTLLAELAKPFEPGQEIPGQMKGDTFGTSDSARSEPQKEPTHEGKVKRQLSGGGNQSGATPGILRPLGDFSPLRVV